MISFTSRQPYPKGKTLDARWIREWVVTSSGLVSFCLDLNRISGSSSYTSRVIKYLVSEGVSEWVSVCMYIYTCIYEQKILFAGRFVAQFQIGIRMFRQDLPITRSRSAVQAEAERNITDKHVGDLTVTSLHLFTEWLLLIAIAGPSRNNTISNCT